MIEQTLLDYGVMGMMLVAMMATIRYMAKRDEKRDEVMHEVVTNNTIALTRFSETTKKCEADD